ncbi:HD domain-containing phosphohydrolase [Paenibacillus sp. y28]|uniref:HD domain-containing phosphohydrolase n=1 Tax=Paenibacillus sp. y28 TaxID=3129110 RepID=UPI00301AC84C
MVLKEANAEHQLAALQHRTSHSTICTRDGTLQQQLHLLLTLSFEEKTPVLHAAIYKRQGAHLHAQTVYSRPCSRAESEPDEYAEHASGGSAASAYFYGSSAEFAASRPDWHVVPLYVEQREWGLLAFQTVQDAGPLSETLVHLAAREAEIVIYTHLSRTLFQLQAEAAAKLRQLTTPALLLEYLAPEIQKLVQYDALLLTFPDPIRPFQMLAACVQEHEDGSLQHSSSSGLLTLPYPDSRTELTLIEGAPRIEAAAAADSPLAVPEEDRLLLVNSLHRYEAASVLRVPVILSGDRLAVLHLYSRLDSHYGEAEQIVMQRIVTLLSFAVQHIIDIQIKRLKRTFRQLSERMARQLLKAVDLHEGALKISELTRKLLQYEQTLIWFMDAENLMLRSVHDPALDMKITDSNVISGLFFNKKTVYFNAIEDLGWIAPQLADRPAKSVLLAPLVDSRDNQVNGLVVMIDMRHALRFNDFIRSQCDNHITSQGGPLANLILKKNLERSNLTLIRTLTKALDQKDTETQGHSERVVAYSLAIARQMKLSEEEISSIRWGALLHDIGKIGIPDAILLKPDKLSSEEWTVMRSHSTIGFEMLKDIEFLENALDIVLYHHERYDGKGYPHGLKREEIPLGARIFALADTFDAITSDRPYRKAQSVEKAKQVIEEHLGTQFCPDCAKAFLSIPDQTLLFMKQNAHRQGTETFQVNISQRWC